MKKKLSKGGKIAIFIIGIIVLLFVVASIVSTPTDGGSDPTSSAAEGGEQQSLKGKVVFQRLIAQVPIDRMLLETDSPDMGVGDLT